MRRTSLLLLVMISLTPLWSQEELSISIDTNSVDLNEIASMDLNTADDVLDIFSDDSSTSEAPTTKSKDTITVEDSVNVIDTAAVDSTEVDSVEIIAKRESLIQLLKDQSRYLYTHPESADTLFNPYEINRIKYSRDDYFTWNEVLRSTGEHVSSYYSPRFYNNVNLWRGYVLPLQDHRTGVVSGAATASQIFPNYEPLQIENLTLDANGKLTPSLFPKSRVATQVYLLMENGLFNGNSLELRIMRNLTRHLSLGLFSSYRNLDQVDYSHTEGGISSFYSSIYSDSSKASFNGRNPYSANHQSVVHLNWEKESKLDFIYRYEDLSNDMIYPFDSLPDTSDYDTVWFNRNEYNSDMRVLGEIPLAEKFRLDFDGNIHTSVQSETPLSTKFISNTERRGGKQKYQAAGAELHFAPTANDTISAVSSVNRSETFHTSERRTILYETDLGVSSIINSDNTPLEIALNAGATSLQYYSENNFYPKVGFSAQWRPSNFILEGWGKVDLVPVVVPFDEEFMPTKVKFLGDSYLGTGVRATFMREKLALTTGFSRVEGVSDRTVQKFWQNGMAPYTNPGNVFTITPSFGEWKGLSLTSSWHFADTKPFVKSFSEVTMRVNKPGKTRHFYTSVYLNYWSRRDNVVYVGREDWNTPIYDLGTKLTAEIKSFRLFLKMDNLLNRSNSYVPGYYMPGIIFRWGFAWTITG